MKRIEIIHGLLFAVLASLFLFIIHHLPVNQLFIDPFSEAIKNHDVMDVSFSKFRKHSDPSLFDDQVMVLNSEITNRQDILDAVEFLQNRGVKGIGLDLLFDSLHHDRTDTLLAESLSQPNVVLAYTFIEDGTHGAHEGSHKRDKTASDHEVEHEESTVDLRSHSFFTKSAHEAYVNLGSNDGFSVRNFEPFHEIDGEKESAFAVVLASFLDDSVVEKLKERDHKKEWINFRRFQPGKANRIHPINESKYSHYAYSSVKNLLKDSSSYDVNYFKNKVVLFGFSGESDDALSMKDRYFTPLNQKYQGKSLPDMHGVVVHANIISMLVSKDYIDDIPEKGLYLIAFLIYFFNYLLFTRIAKHKLYFQVPTVRLIQVLQFIVLFSLSVIAVTFWNVKVGFVLIITAVILSYELFEFYAHKLKAKLTPIFTRRNKVDSEET